LQNNQYMTSINANLTQTNSQLNERISYAN
jgi:hypothetical protein